MLKTIKEVVEEMELVLDQMKGADTPEALDAALSKFEDLKGEKARIEAVAEAEKSFVASKPARKKIARDDERDAVKEFAAAARAGFKGLNEGTPADGGYTVPEDIVTRVENLRAAKASLIDLVGYETVSTNRGARTFKKRSQQKGFTKVAEGGNISKTSKPEFGRYEYNIEKYAGYLPVTAELLDDSDEKIVAVVTEWIADESRVTRNNIIIEAMNSKYTRKDAPEAVIEIKDLDGIKHVLNVVLGQAFKPTSVIVTNDDGLQLLDTLKNADGEYLLKSNPQDPMKMRLSAGATTVPVEVIPNDDLPSENNYVKTSDVDIVAGKIYYTTADSETYVPVSAPETEQLTNYYEVDGGKAPFYIGDLKEGVKFFDRRAMSIKSSDVAAIGELNAYEGDLTLFRAIEREDCVVRDDKAFYKCQWVFGTVAAA